jgi:hypothetical protein
LVVVGRDGYGYGEKITIVVEKEGCILASK